MERARSSSSTQRIVRFGFKLPPQGLVWGAAAQTPVQTWRGRAREAATKWLFLFTPEQ
jgi:hypothetical protein